MAGELFSRGCFLDSARCRPPLDGELDVCFAADFVCFAADSFGFADDFGVGFTAAGISASAWAKNGAVSDNGLESAFRLFD